MGIFGRVLQGSLCTPALAEDLDEISIGNGYMKEMRIRNMPITGKMNCITRIYT